MIAMLLCVFFAVFHDGLGVLLTSLFVVVDVRLVEGVAQHDLVETPSPADASAPASPAAAAGGAGGGGREWRRLRRWLPWALGLLGT